VGKGGSSEEIGYEVFMVGGFFFVREEKPNKKKGSLGGGSIYCFYSYLERQAR